MNTPSRRRKIGGKFYHRIKAFDYEDKREAKEFARRLRKNGTYDSVRIVVSAPESKYFGKVLVVYGR